MNVSSLLRFAPAASRPPLRPARSMRNAMAWVLVIGHWSLGLLSSAQACVGCREPGSETIHHESPTVLAGFAFSWSVLFMLAFALLVVGGMGAFIWHTCQRIERERARS